MGGICISGNSATACRFPDSGTPNATLDAHVASAWQSKQLSDGTRLNLGHTDREQAFVVAPEGTRAIAARTGTQRCDDGSQQLAARILPQDILPDTGGHTHPLGRTGDVSGLPGPNDGVMALVTGKPAYLVSPRGAFAIEKQGDNFSVRQLAGKPLTRTEQGEVLRIMALWNQHSGGSGRHCTFTPN